MLYNQALDMEEALDCIAQIHNEEEKKVATLLLEMGFDLVDSNVVLQDYPGPVRGEIDLVFESSSILLLVEVYRRIKVRDHSSEKPGIGHLI